MNHKYIYKGIGAIIVLGILFGAVRFFAPTQQALQYRNDQYGFSFALPQDWKGYTILDQTWTGSSHCSSSSTGYCQTDSGPEIVIRNPNWTADKPWQDIPIMVFTPDQWNEVQQWALSVGAAPVPPTELGSNSQYVFALPAHYNFSPLEGDREVDDILRNNPLSTEQPVATTTTGHAQAAKVPEGWYSHQVGGYDESQAVLTRTKELPKANPNNYAYGEHIAIVERDLGLTPPDEYVKQNVSVSGPTVQYATWGTLFGRKMLSVGFTDPNDGSKQQNIYLFGGGRFVLINLYPDKQDNRAAFQQVVNYYAQTLPVISREETLTACKTVNLPPGQEYDIQADSETGYVTIGYWLGTGPGTGDTEIYAFFNDNDDLSQCTASVKKVLEIAKTSGNKITP